MYYKIIIIFAVTFILRQTNGNALDEEVKNSTKFSFDLYRNIFNEKQNTIISPFSIRVLLSILYQSANGQTRDELRENAYFTTKSKSFYSQRQVLRRNLNPNITIVNKIYVKNEGTIRPSFKSIVTRLHGNIEQVDFSQMDEVTKQMNIWVEKETNGQIQNIVPLSVIKPNFSLFILNSFEFIAQWKNPFELSNVHLGTFIDIYKDVHQVEIMSNKGKYNVTRIEHINASIIEIPYTNESKFLFWILLPDEETDIEQLHEVLSYELIQEIADEFFIDYVNLLLPMFEVEMSIDCVHVLKKMGLKSIFNKPELNIIENSKFLYVDDIKQKNKMSVNTNGTKISSNDTITNAEIYMEYEDFYVNRPFIYLILTADIKEPIFIGHYSTPN